MTLISNNIAVFTLILTALLTVITFFYTYFTRRMLLLASQPTITIKPFGASISPDIPNSASIAGPGDDLAERRYCIAIELALVNIGGQPAQNIYVDAESHFRVSRPLGHESLPIHLPEFIPFLPPPTTENNRVAKVSIRFDNFVGRELIRDFFKGQRINVGDPFLPSRGEMENRALWPSARIDVNCFYTDIQGQNYLSQVQLFFSIRRDEERGAMDIHAFGMNELQFVGIRPVTARFRERYINRNRPKRYMAFDGSRYDKHDLLLLFRGWRTKSEKARLAEQGTNAGRSPICTAQDERAESGSRQKRDAFTPSQCPFRRSGKAQ